jgi:hypothetical protein
VLFAALPAPSMVALLVATGGSLQASVQATTGFALSNLPPLRLAGPMFRTRELRTREPANRVLLRSQVNAEE